MNNTLDSLQKRSIAAVRRRQQTAYYDEDYSEEETTYVMLKRGVSPPQALFDYDIIFQHSSNDVPHVTYDGTDEIAHSSSIHNAALVREIAWSDEFH